MNRLEKVVRKQLKDNFVKGLIDDALFTKASEQISELVKGGDKIPKEAVIYTFRPETQYTCDKCVFAKEKAVKCAVLGAAEEIKPYGSCGFWIHIDPNQPNAPQIPWLGTVTKQEAGYDENKTGFSCKRCEYFVVGKNDCLVVDKDSEGDTPNEIHPNSCCNRFEADKKRAKMKTEELNELLAR